MNELNYLTIILEFKLNKINYNIYIYLYEF